MIIDFGNQGTADIFDGLPTKKAQKVLPKTLWANAAILMDQLDAATQPSDMQMPPSNRLHKLKGDLKGFWSVSINMQYRIIFTFEDGNAHVVQIVDYH